jgi:hypothetical protein
VSSGKVISISGKSSYGFEEEAYSGHSYTLFVPLSIEVPKLPKTWAISTS